MALDIITCGFPLVELYRKYPDQPLNKNGEFIGPFAAGDPIVAVIACMMQGHTGGYVGVVGKDKFAECFLEGMNRNGVDVSHIRTNPDKTTGISMLAKYSDGSREFLFTLRDSAAGTLGVEDYDAEFFNSARCIHLSGASYSVAPSLAELQDKVIANVSNDTLVTFDPNYRNNLIEENEFVKITRNAFERCDLFLPSMGEAKMFCPEAVDDIEACRRIAATGKMVALKDGANGAYGFFKNKEIFVKAFKVEEIDPTGAGDTFGGALTGALLNGKDFFTALYYGAAAGALAANRMGLMENVPNRKDVENVLKQAGVI